MLVYMGLHSHACASKSRLIEGLSILHHSSAGWSGQGCYVKSIDAHQTDCTCNHLTHFAVLLEVSSSLESAGITEVDVTITPRAALYNRT